MTEQVTTPPPTPAFYRQAISTISHPDLATGPAARLGEAVRELARTVVGSMASDEALEDARARVEAVTAALAEHRRDSRYEQADAAPGPGTFANHPMIGPANPCSPRIDMQLEGDALVGHVTFHTPQEGPPGCGYGGYVAAGFDAILLMTAGINGFGGPTRSLSVRYRKPTPLNTPLRYVAEIDRSEERYTVVRGRLLAGDVVCAEGTAEVSHKAMRMEIPNGDVVVIPARDAI